MSNSTETIEQLAAEIGENIYIDIAKWHLFLADAHLHTVLAERLYPFLEDNEIDEGKVLQILQDIQVKVGGGKRQLPLSDLLPMQCQVNLMDILEECQNNLF